MRKITKSHLIGIGTLSLLVFYSFNRSYEIYKKSKATQAIDRLNDVFNQWIDVVRDHPLYLEHDQLGIGISLIGVVVIWLIFIYWWSNQKNYRIGEEYGSASWGENTDIRRMMDKKFSKNILLTETERISMNSKKTRLNNNILVVGGSGSGKTRFFVKPNIMQMHSTYVITDSKGLLLKETGKMLEDNGYKIKVFNLIEMDKSDKYNPLSYIRLEKDILKLVNNLITNTTPMQSKERGDFWEKAEKALLTAIIGYIYYEGTEDEKHMGTVLMMLRMAEVKEDQEDFVSPLDVLFEELDKEHFASKQYDLYKLAAGKTAKSILVSIGVRLSPFYINEVEDLVSEDTLELDRVGCEKTALFVVIPDIDITFNFIAAMMFQQLFETLIEVADKDYEGRLPYHVRCLLDEFANIGEIPDFERLIAVMRSREISANIILQNLTQLKNRYKTSWETITGNCDSFLFLGGKEQSTLEYVSKIMGKATIDKRDISQTKGQNGSYTLQPHSLGRELLTADEIGRLGNDECILSIRGLRPFKSHKIRLESHKNYKQLSDYKKTNTYDFEKEQAEGKRFFDSVGSVEELDLGELN